MLTSKQKLLMLILGLSAAGIISTITASRAQAWPWWMYYYPPWAYSQDNSNYDPLQAGAN